MSGRHPVNPRRQRSARRPNPRRRPKAARDTASPRRSCAVGRALVPVLGARRVLTIAAAGGLLPYLAARADGLAARLAGVA